MAIDMMDEVDVTHIFWGEELQALVHLSNKTNLRPNSDKNPYDLWKGRLSSVKHYKVFGRLCFIKRNDKNPESLIHMLMRVCYLSTLLRVKNTNVTIKGQRGLRVELV